MTALHRRGTIGIVVGCVVTFSTQDVCADLSSETRERIRACIESRDPAALMIVGQRIYAATSIARFYESRGFEPAWLRDGCPSGQLAQLLAHVQNAESDGLRGSDYHVGTLTHLLARARDGCPSSWSGDEAASLELLATDAFLMLGSHLVAGRINPETLTGEWHAQRRERDLTAALTAALASRDVAVAMAALRPSADEYRRLLTALERYRQVRDRGGWPALEVGSTISVGAHGRRVAELRIRLSLEGYTSQPTHTSHDEVFDEQLASAVRAFQSHRGLPSDGAVDDRTRAALDVPVEQTFRSAGAPGATLGGVPGSLGESVEPEALSLGLHRLCSLFGDRSQECACNSGRDRREPFQWRRRLVESPWPDLARAPAG